jgi:hypothetical protein
VAAAERGVGDVRDGLPGEDSVLAVDEDEVMAARLRDARDVARAGQTHVHAERYLAGLHHLFEGIRQDRGVGQRLLLARLERLSEAPCSG